MQRNNKANRVGAIIFLAFLFLLFSLAGVLYVTKGASADLLSKSSREIENIPGSHQRMSLEAGDYRVLEMFDKKREFHDPRFGPKIDITYGYYAVEIRDKDGEKTVIVVRADLDKKDLAESNDHRLVGFVAELPEDVQEKLERSYTGSTPICEVMLTDDPDWGTTGDIVLCAVALVGIVVIVVTIFRKRSRGQ